MKHNTHIYLAAKAIELTRAGVDNTFAGKKKYLTSYAKGKERRAAEQRRRILEYYKHLTTEATWAPDDVLRDNDPHHIFKLFTDEEFPDHGLEDKPTFEDDGVTYYKFAGGLPYKIDHNAQEIVAMAKLRDYNDQFELRQIMYKYLLISHYLADAHVPMHCDLRDDPPSKTNDDQPSRRHGSGKPKGKYMKSSAHAKLEGIWDEAVTPVAIAEHIVPKKGVEGEDEMADLSDIVTFDFDDCKKGADVKVRIIPEGGLMDFMIDICIQSKQRGQRLFPLDNPKELNEEVLPEVTREIFADAIGNLMAVWRYIWTRSNA